MTNMNMAMQKLSPTTKIQTDLNAGWLTIWLDSPENKNAIGDKMIAELLGVMDAVREDRAIRGITLRGKNDIFCSGGDLKNFTGIDSPYEQPKSPEILVDTSSMSAEQCAEQIIRILRERGVIFNTDG